MIDIKSMVVFLSRYEHVPKINGEIPSADEATSDHERLLNKSCMQKLLLSPSISKLFI
ncbi:hypothetical protein ACS0TY_030683 [Phlomoides rotata]